MFMPIENFMELLSQQILAGIILVARLGASPRAAAPARAALPKESARLSRGDTEG